MPDEPTTGATPGAGATPGQAGQPTTTTPAAPGATPAAGTTAPAAAQSTATDDDAALGEAGKKAIAEARRLAKEAETRARNAERERDAASRERDELRDANATDAEKATKAAVKEAERVITERFEARIRRSEVRSALTAAGITSTELDLALMAPDFAGLRVTEDGVTGLTEAVTTFKALHPALFTRPAAPVADLGGGSRGTTPDPGTRAAEALASGDIRGAIHLKTQKLQTQRKG